MSKMDWRFVFSEATGGLRRNLTMAVAVVVTTTVSLTLLGVSLLLNAQVEELKGYWYDKVEVSVFLCGTSSDSQVCPEGEVTDTQRTQIEAAITALPVTAKVYYESKEETWERFKEQHTGSRVLSEVTVDTMPESFRVKLDDPTQFAQVASAISPINGVEVVKDQRRLLEPFFKVVNGLQIAALATALAQVLVTILLVFNTVRSTVHSRRREVGVMQLVGASRAMIRGPFLAEIALAGFIGALLAIAALSGLQHFVIENILTTANQENSVYISWSDIFKVAPQLLILGLLLPMCAAWFALRKYLRI